MGNQNFGNSTLFSGSLSGSLSSQAVFLGGATGYSFQIASTGVIGTAELQSSLDNGGTLDSAPTIHNWTTIAQTSQPVSGSFTALVYNVAGAFYPWVRVQYIHTSGTGSVEIISNVKNR